MGKVAELKETDFETVVLQSPIPVLIDFWSPGCGPCRALVPVLEGLSEEFAGEVHFFKMNVYENTALAAQLGIEMLPTVIIYRNGQIVERLTGAQTKAKLQELLDNCLE